MRYTINIGRRLVRTPPIVLLAITKQKNEENNKKNGRKRIPLHSTMCAYVCVRCDARGEIDF